GRHGGGDEAEGPEKLSALQRPRGHAAHRPHTPDPRAPGACRPPGPRRRQVRRLRPQQGTREGGGQAPAPACGAPAPEASAERRSARDGSRAAGGREPVLEKAARVSYSLIVFDWDGTLIDSAGTIAECIQQAARDLGLEPPSREQATHVIGLGLHDSLRIAVPGLPAARYAEFVERYRVHFRARENEMPLFAGIEPLLRQLSRSHRLAIATGKSRRGLERALETTALRGYFGASRCADETHPKPHPAMLLE